MAKLLQRIIRISVVKIFALFFSIRIHLFFGCLFPPVGLSLYCCSAHTRAVSQSMQFVFAEKFSVTTLGFWCCGEIKRIFVQFFCFCFVFSPLALSKDLHALIKSTIRQHILNVLWQPKIQIREKKKTKLTSYLSKAYVLDDLKCQVKFAASVANKKGDMTKNIFKLVMSFALKNV